MKIREKSEEITRDDKMSEGTNFNEIIMNFDVLYPN